MEDKDVLRADVTKEEVEKCMKSIKKGNYQEVMGYQWIFTVLFGSNRGLCL